MDRRVQLLQQVETGRTPSGQRTLEWLPFATPWAERVPNRGQESFRAQASQRVSTIECSYRIRYRDGVDTTARLRDMRDGKVYEIVAVIEIGRRAGLELMVTARAEAGA